MQQTQATQKSIIIVTIALIVGPLPFVALRLLIPGIPVLELLQLPALAIGIAAPLVALAVYRSMCGKIRAHDDPRRRATAFQTATMLPLAITEAAAFLGIVAFDPGGNPWPLVGLAGHLLLAIAIWPGPARFDAWVEGPGD